MSILFMSFVFTDGETFKCDIAAPLHHYNISSIYFNQIEITEVNLFYLN